MLEEHNALVCHVRNGRVTEVWEHHEDLHDLALVPVAVNGDGVTAGRP